MLLERTVAEVRPGKDNSRTEKIIHVEPSGSNPASTENGSSEVIDS